MLTFTFLAIGFDLSYFQGDVSESVFSCLLNDGYDFGIIEATAGSEYELNPYSTLIKKCKNETNY